MRLKTPMSEVRAAVNEGVLVVRRRARAPPGSCSDELFGVDGARRRDRRGNLDEVLGRLADFLEGAQKLKSKVSSAMIYPIIMVVVGTIIMFVLMVKVVPNITSMFTQSGKVLPLNTRFLIWTSDFLGNNILWTSSSARSCSSCCSGSGERAPAASRSGTASCCACRWSVSSCAR